MSGSLLGDMAGPVDFYFNTGADSDTGSTSDFLVSTPMDIKTFDHILLETRCSGGTNSDASATWQVEYQTSYPAYATLPASDYAVDASTDIWLNWTGATNGTATLGNTSSDGVSAPYLIDLFTSEIFGTGGGSIRMKYFPGQAKMRFVTTAMTYGGTRHAIGGNATDRVIKK